MVVEMTKRIQENPDYSLPEGYHKVTEKDQVLTYSVPDCFEEQHQVCLGVLDDLLHEAIGVHFLEPVITYQTKTKVRASIAKRAKRTDSAAKLLQSVETMDRTPPSSS